VTIVNKVGGSFAPCCQFVVQLCNCCQVNDSFYVFVQYCIYKHKFYPQPHISTCKLKFVSFVTNLFETKFCLPSNLSACQWFASTDYILLSYAWQRTFISIAFYCLLQYTIQNKGRGMISINIVSAV
jgi:hypothetical protein